MYYAEIIGYMGADYRFGSHEFKWVYYNSLHFARQACYLHPWVCPIIIRFNNGMRIAVNDLGMTIDSESGIFDIWKEDK